jgi:glycosyltransferase involved in cell wall biosynthesis
MAPLSVAIITLNEEKNIGRCLESLKDIADEIVVVDSGSSDKTREICEGFGVRFIIQPFLGYIQQKNFALDATTNPHVLSLDADEALSPELKNSIEAAKASGFPCTGYTMNRLSWFCDSWIRHGSWYPDRKLRLVLKSVARWGGMNPHDKLEIDNSATVKKLDGDLLHYTYYSIVEFIQQGNNFSTISANAMYQKGIRAGYFNLIWNPFIAFLKSYIIRGGFLDGFNGYIIARQSGTHTFLKYAKLLQLQRMHKTEA